MMVNVLDKIREIDRRRRRFVFERKEEQND